MKRLLFVLMCASVSTGAAAQERRWEVEGYAGSLVAQPSSAGTATLPPAGPPLVTTLPTFPSRATPSWFFGDGASLVNGVLQDFGLANRITPLDAAFAPLPPARVAAFGARVRRRLDPHVSLEIGVDAFAGSPADTGELAAIVEASRASFAPAFVDLFASGPFSRTAVLAQGVTNRGSFRETAFTVAVNRDIARLSALQPYFTLGGGVVATSGTLPSASLQGRYMTAVLGDVPIDESDRVSIRFARPTTFAIVAGGGVRHDVSSNWSVRVDARWLIGPDTTRVTIDAQPSVVRGTPAGFVESFTNPAIQFSNDPATGRRSSLSGAALQNVDMFNGGIIARTTVSIGIARRF